MAFVVAARLIQRHNGRRSGLAGPALVLFEIEIPDLVKVADGQHADLKTAGANKLWDSSKILQAGWAGVRLGTGRGGYDRLRGRWKDC